MTALESREDEPLHVVVGDASGKGVSASLVGRAEDRLTASRPRSSL